MQMFPSAWAMFNIVHTIFSPLESLMSFAALFFTPSALGPSMLNHDHQGQANLQQQVKGTPMLASALGLSKSSLRL